MAQVSIEKEQDNSQTASKMMFKREGFSAQEVDEKVPFLAFMGLACWMLWNTIAFSGSFWLLDITDTIRAENVVTVSTIASVVTMIATGFFEKRVARFLSQRWYTIVTGLLGAVGTMLIIITREAILPSRTLFLWGCAIAGVGLGGLFMRAAPMLGALPPRRSLTVLMICLLVDSLGYLYLNNCPREAANVVFGLLPVMSSLFYLIHAHNSVKEERASQPLEGSPNKLAVFFASVVLCSAALELIRAYIVIGFPPSVSMDCTVTARLALVPVLLITLLALLFQKEDVTAQIYTAIVSILVVLLIVLGAFPSKSTAIASATIALCSSFQVVVWSMLAYIAFQAQSGSIKLLGYGGGALYLGTLLSSLVAMNYQNSGIDDAIMRVIVVVLGILVLIDVMFVFTSKRISELLLPIDEELYHEEGSSESQNTPDTGLDDKKGRFVRACEVVANANGLSPRETEVLIELARGWTAQEIAEKKVLSIYTVRAHIRSIYAKLDVHSGKELREYIGDPSYLSEK